MLNKFTDFLEKKLQPIAEKISQNTIINSISQGMLGIISLTVGVCFVSIAINLPIESWTNFLNAIGVMAPANELLSATTSLLAIYIVISIAYSHAKNVGQNPKSVVILAVASFIILMPQSITIGEETVNALKSDYLGSNGIFIAILIGILVSVAYNFLINKNIKINMPEQVPSMVSESMTPIFASMIIFGVVFLIKWGLSLTSYNNIFNLFYTFLTEPIMAIFGTTVMTPILYCVLRAIFWFFGIHPSPLNAIYFPISTACIAANVEASMAGANLPYLSFVIITAFGMIGGTGSTFALNLNMLTAKSERYKAVNKVAFIPGLFNINEPLVFGVPIMYNPLMLIPTILAPIVGSLIGIAFVALNFINSTNFNPSVSVAWVIPYPIAAFLRGGFPFAIAVILALVAQYFIFLPFFKVLDNKAYKEEQEILHKK